MPKDPRGFGVGDSGVVEFVNLVHFHKNVAVRHPRRVIGAGPTNFVGFPSTLYFLRCTSYMMIRHLGRRKLYSTIQSPNTNTYCSGARIGPSLALSSASCINGSSFVYLGRDYTEQRLITNTLWNVAYFSITSGERYERTIGLINYTGESSSSKTSMMRVSIKNSFPLSGSTVRIVGLGPNLSDDSTVERKELAML